MDKVEAQEIAKELNLLIAKATSHGRMMPEDLKLHMFQVIRNLSLGIYAESDIEEAKMFMDQGNLFYTKNQETIEKVINEVQSETVGTSAQSDRPSIIIP